MQDLLDHMCGREAVLGLLTGNIAGGAEIKTRHFGLSAYFGFGAYGDDHHDRNRLGPIALKRAAQRTGRRFSGEETVVIGDTPKDIACGRAIGALTVCVATGMFTAAQLRSHGADLVVDDFADAGGLVDEITGR